MTQIIYGDVLFVINLAMDYLALYLTAGLLGVKKRTLRMLTAAAVGALYAVIGLIMPGNTWVTALLSAAVSLLMCYTAYGSRRLIRSAIVFCGVNFMLGGSVTALYGLINRSRHVLINGEVSTLYGELPPMWLVMLAAVSAVLSYLWGRIRTKRNKTVRVTADADSMHAEFDGISDSGNLLREPISGLPVVVVSPDIMRELVPCDLFGMFESGDIGSLTEKSPHLARRMRVIPASTVTDSALLPALKCDRILVDGIEREGLVACGRLNGRQAVVPEIMVG
nr:sigma-E processing peptidase SpoIIGA [Clostridia bacterium]